MTERTVDVSAVELVADDSHRFSLSLHRTSSEPKAVLIFLSALGTPARVYGRFARELVGHGIHVATPDWRGIGSSSLRAGRGSDFGYRHLLEHDLTATLALVAHRFPDLPVWIGGHSLGGQLALLTAATHQQQIAGVVLVASGSVFLRGYSPKLQRSIRGLIWLSRLTTPVFGYFPGQHLGFGGREARRVMRDWSNVALTGEYRPHGSRHDYEAGLCKLNCPVLALNFAADAWSPAGAIDELLRKIPDHSRTKWLWDSSQCGGHAFDHFSWTKQPALITPAIAGFITQAARG
jgi:predicted alpha/beta hydrolase